MSDGAEVPFDSPSDVPAQSPLRSVHTSNFPDLLSQLNASLVVSTYQAGRLILLRPDGEELNTHFRAFNKPMGVAIAGDRMAIGTAMDIAEYHNIPAAGTRTGSERPNDACFLPRQTHSTGDIQIHEMEWGVSERQAESGERKDTAGDALEAGTDADFRSPPSAFDSLWFVNTRFSCLCTRSSDYSFAPQWRPPFITAYTPQDRCHLNGMGMVDGRPKYVTALGETDSPAGWRDNKATGGILMDVPTGEIITRGLSMPHSPRWHNGKLWVLNSGEGGIGTVDPATGQYEQVTELPGFTRGLSFVGRFAFVGLSQVRESAVFSGIRIAERPEKDRWSGVAVVDTVRGETVAWLRFEDAVQEVFAVGVLHGRVWPDLINDDAEVIGSTWVLPDEALKDVPEDWRQRTDVEAIQSDPSG